MSKFFVSAPCLTSLVIISMLIPDVVCAQGRSAEYQDMGVGVERKPAEGAKKMRTLTPKEEEEGLKALLHHCVRSAAQKLGVEGGFRNNTEAYIPVPLTLQRVEYTLREIGESEMIDDFLTRINRAAEVSIPRVAGYFLLAVGQLRPKDVETVKADNNVSAATLILHHRMAKGLIEVVRPVIEESLVREEVDLLYDDMVKLYQKNAYDRSVTFSVDNYVIENVLEEFFVFMSKEEKALRADPSLCPEPLICAFLTGKIEVKEGGGVEDIGLMQQEAPTSDGLVNFR